jgi:transposase-like protein
LRGVAQVLAVLEVPSVSYVTLWRNLQRWGQRLRRPRLQARIVGVDTTFVRIRGKSQGILVAVALGGKTILVQAVGGPQDYHQAFTTLRRLGAEVVVSDDDQAFVDPLERLAMDRQGCVWHAARALGRALRKLTAQEREQWQELITLLWESLKALPPRPPDALFHAQTLPLPPPLRWAVVYLLNLWHRLTLYQRRPALPKTNNLSERAIQQSKHRARTLRGFKSLAGAVNFFAATQYLLAAA